VQPPFQFIKQCVDVFLASAKKVHEIAIEVIDDFALAARLGQRDAKPSRKRPAVAWMGDFGDSR
jgi:hypothetical protein